MTAAASPFWERFAQIRDQYATLGYITPRVMSLDFRTDTETFDYTTLEQRARSSRIAVISAAGTGKTTLLLRLLEDICVNTNKQPVFLPLADYEHSEEFDQFVARNLPDDITPDKIGDAHYVAWDGVNEAQKPDLPSVFKDIQKFHSVTGAPFLLSCRPDEYPFGMRAVGGRGPPLEEVQIAPLDSARVREKFIELFQLDSPSQAMARRGLDRLSALCVVPLYYAMVQDTVAKSPLAKRQQVINAMLGASTKTDVYRQFIDETLVREESKTLDSGIDNVTAALAEFTLSRLGMHMQCNDIVYWEGAHFEKFLRELLGSKPFTDLFPEVQSSEWPTLIKTLRRRPPLRPIAARTAHNKVAFLHQSIGEYFAALKVFQAKRDDEEWQNELTLLLEPTTKRNWPTIEFVAGFPNMEEPVIECIADFAMDKKRQDLLVLAARCVTDTQHAKPIVVEDLQIRMMEAFKNWGRAFDYELVHELAELGKRGVRRPRTERISLDIDRFVKKYSEFRPAPVPDLTLAALCDIVEKGNPNEAADAAYTIGLQGRTTDSAKVAKRLVAAYPGCPWQVREQIVAALKDINAVDQFDLIAQIVGEPPLPEAVRTQVFAMNALADFKDLRAIPVVTDYLNDGRRLFRDSAAWSLQKLALRAQELGEAEKVAAIKSNYWHVLTTEQESNERKYLIGNILYSLGKLRAQEYAQPIVDWAPRESEPYVLEDLVFGLGLIGDAQHAGFVSRFTEHADPAVRLKALEALELLNATAMADVARRCLDDEFPVVRQLAASVETKLRAPSA